MLRKNYPKEAALWLQTSEITELLVRSATHTLLMNNVLLCFSRLFYSPQPPVRAILDAVISFSAAVHRSLQVRLLHQRVISFEFSHHVFNFVFNKKGTPVKHKPGCLYEGTDFSEEFFNNNHFEIYKKHNEGCFITFLFICVVLSSSLLSCTVKMAIFYLVDLLKMLL